MTATTTDDQVTVLLPTSTRAVPPMTARRQRRAILGYAVLWLCGAVAVATTAGPGWTALGLGLAFPGGGFFAGGHTGWAVLSLVLVFVAVLLWWMIGPVVLPPLVWLGTAVASALVVDATDTRRSIAALLVGPALIAAAHLTHRVRHAQQARTGPCT